MCKAWSRAALSAAYRRPVRLSLSEKAQDRQALLQRAVHFLAAAASDGAPGSAVEADGVTPSELMILSAVPTLERLSFSQAEDRQALGPAPWHALSCWQALAAAAGPRLHTLEVTGVSHIQFSLPLDGLAALGTLRSLALKALPGEVFPDQASPRRECHSRRRLAAANCETCRLNCGAALRHAQGL